MFGKQLKILIRNRSMMFWSLAFPIILGTFFFMAFSNLTDSETLTSFNVGIVGESEFKNVLEEIEFIDLYELSLDKAEENLEEGSIVGYYLVDEEIELFVRYNSTSTTILKNILDTYYVYGSVFENIVGETGNMEVVFSGENFINDISGTSTDFTNIFFYTLIGMFCIFAGMFGINAVTLSEANMSMKGARISVSSSNKLKYLMTTLLVSMLIMFVEFLILYLYLSVILGIEFANVLQLFIVALLGCFVGITFGVLIGSISKRDEEGKNSILTAVTMAGAFLAGMMNFQVKYQVDNNFPFLSRINPVNMITDGLLSIYYENFDRFLFNVFSLLTFSIVAIIISYLFLRRKTYDSI